MALLKKMLAQFGIEEERLRMEWVSASEGDRYAAIVNDMTAQIKNLGSFKAQGYLTPAATH
jgi:F420-non-reducing hydrogenase iron-sulfur subunit